MTASTKIALVTGGARGIGLGISLALAKEGWTLAVCGVRDEAAAAEGLEKIRQTGGQAVYFKADIGSAGDREALVTGLRKKFGRIDLLVNNAGVAPNMRADILDAGEESFDRLIGINLKGPYFLTQAVAKWMSKEKKGAIVFVTSISAAVASVTRGDYCISKAGLSMVVQLFAVRLAEFGIPVYEVRPGVIATDMTSGVKEKYDKLISEGLLLEPRWGTPEDVGRAVAMLGRGDLPYATGQVVTLDGGLMRRRL